MFQFRRLLVRYNGFIAPIVLCVVAVLVFVFVEVPFIQNTLTAFQDVSVLKEQVSILEQKIQVLNSLDEASLEKDVALTTSAIPLDKSLPTILRTMEGISDQTGVTLKSLIVDTPGALATQAAAKQQTTEEKKLGAFTLPFAVSLTGTFDQIKTFLSVSNKVRRIIRAKSFTLNFNEEQLTTQISFDSFYAPLSTRNETERLQPLKNTDIDVLSNLEKFPNMGQIGGSTITPNTIQIGKENPFSL